jgi:hypothetical protein
MLYRVKSRNFVAGFITGTTNKVIETAPILWRLRGMDYAAVLRYGKRRGWSIAKVNEGEKRNLIHLPSFSSPADQ